MSAGSGLFRTVASFLIISGIVLSLVSLSFGGDKKKPADYALIFGTVWSADDRPYAGATVKIRRSDQKKAKWVLSSDRRGEFAQRVPAEKADYVVWVEIPKKKAPVTEKTVHIEGNERVDIGLHLP